MAYTNIVTDAAGDSANSASVKFPGGNALFVLTGDDFTGVTVTYQYSENNVTFYTFRANASPANAQVHEHALPAGFVRVGITGGGAGDNIDVNFKVEPQSFTMVEMVLNSVNMLLAKLNKIR